MEFNEKLQELRKQKGLTQEELADALYVSRTAVSKWESGRGYPQIDSLKAIASFFAITIDELLSSDELLSLAQAEQKEKDIHSRDLVFGLLDISTLLLLFLPIFAKRTQGVIQEVSLLALNVNQLILKIVLLAIVILNVIWGILLLALQNCENPFWAKHKSTVSLRITELGILLFIFCSQPYPAAFLFLFSFIKTVLVLKKR